MDAAQWPQEVGLVKPNMEELTITSSSSSNNNNTSASTNPRQTANIQQLQVAYNMVERRFARPQKEHALHCPRCSSTSTKFCYYNNYSLTQPRYFCKACRRYWTEGGSLRNVPVGGGSRKNKKSSAAAASSSSSTSLPTLAPPPIIWKKIPSDDFESPGLQDLQGQDLNLAFPMPCTGTSTMGPSLNPFVPLLHPMGSSSEFYRANASSFPNFDVTVGATSGGGRCGGGGGRVLFPFEETRAQELNDSINANNADVKGQTGGGGDHSPSTGFWSGMLGGGGSSSW